LKSGPQPKLTAYEKNLKLSFCLYLIKRLATKSFSIVKHFLSDSASLTFDAFHNANIFIKD